MSKIDASAATALYRPIHASPRDTCETQRQVAEHNSRHDTLVAGKPVAYKAPCDVPDPKSKKIAGRVL